MHVCVDVDREGMRKRDGVHARACSTNNRRLAHSPTLTRTSEASGQRFEQDGVAVHMVIIQTVDDGIESNW